ncbi:MAG: VanZ family protein [Proteobacteria bacterium]|nr:VanZ family protein [Pseudomonadota bacterium]MBU1140100.1 VanZ family protein [Pseudomonadota bacterium]MBU1418109.1 VanZ family protein [Pseudomonadota bacterium]MBU1453295.1 VanZ family protein [Pseudomonadota bacterium]
MWIRKQWSRLPDSIVILLLRTVPVTLVMGTIFLLSHQSGDTLSLPSFPGADKIAHMLAYGILALTVLWAFGQNGLRKTRRVAIQTVLCCLFYGLSDEYHQSFIPFRSVSGLDLLADIAGALCVTLIWFGSLPLRRKIINFQQSLAIRLNLLYNK